MSAIYVKTNIKINKQGLYVNSAFVKIGSKGKPIAPGVFFASFDKGTARKLRKELVREGYQHIAAYSRNS